MYIDLCEGTKDNGYAERKLSSGRRAEQIVSKT